MVALSTVSDVPAIWIINGPKSRHPPFITGDGIIATWLKVRFKMKRPEKKERQKERNVPVKSWFVYVTRTGKKTHWGQELRTFTVLSNSGKEPTVSFNQPTNQPTNLPPFTSRTRTFYSPNLESPFWVCFFLLQFLDKPCTYITTDLISVDMSLSFHWTCFLPWEGGDLHHFISPVPHLPRTFNQVLNITKLSFISPGFIHQKEASASIMGPGRWAQPGSRDPVWCCTPRILIHILNGVKDLRDTSI